MPKQHDFSDKKRTEFSERLRTIKSSKTPSARKIVFDLYPEIREKIEQEGVTRKEIYNKIFDENFRKKVSLQLFWNYCRAAELKLFSQNTGKNLCSMQHAQHEKTQKKSVSSSAGVEKESGSVFDEKPSENTASVRQEPREG